MESEVSSRHARYDFQFIEDYTFTGQRFPKTTLHSDRRTILVAVIDEKSYCNNQRLEMVAVTVRAQGKSRVMAFVAGALPLSVGRAARRMIDARHGEDKIHTSFTSRALDAFLATEWTGGGRQHLRKRRSAGAPNEPHNVDGLAHILGYYDQFGSRE